MPSAGVIDHVEDADRASLDDDPGEEWLGQQHEGVQWVAVLTEGVLDVAVVRRVGHRGEEVAVEPDAACGVVDLVLVALSARDLDGDVELHVCPFSGASGGCR